MEQLLIHAVGDYWMKNDWRALNKKNDFKIALLHAGIYTLPFMLLTTDIWKLLAIMITHAIIDGTHIVNYLNQIKNWNFITPTGFDLNRPDWISVWLIIIQDNILHLVINYLILCKISSVTLQQVLIVSLLYAVGNLIGKKLISKIV
jgi:hypothetical protein